MTLEQMGADKDSRFQVQKKAGGATNQSSQPRSLINDKGENYELCCVNKLSLDYVDIIIYKFCFVNSFL